MRKISKVLGMLSAVTTLTLIGAAGVYAGQWRSGSSSNAGRWWYANNDGTFLKNGWYWLDGDSDGTAECYYFDSDGWLVTSTTVDGSEVNKDGKWMVNGKVQTRDFRTETAQNEAIETVDAFDTPDTGTASYGSTKSSKSSSSKSSALTVSGETLIAMESPFSTSRTVEVSSSSKSNSGSSSSNVITEGDFAVYDGDDFEIISDLFSGPGMASSGKSSSSSSQKKISGSSSDLPRSEATELVSYARNYIGVLPYVSGGESLESGADCSAFCQLVFKHFGISIPRDSRSQYAAAKKISLSDLKAGDLVFYASGDDPSTIHHVGIYSGNGTIIAATHTGDYVREYDVYYAEPYGFGRFS